MSIILAALMLSCCVGSTLPSAPRAMRAVSVGEDTATAGAIDRVNWDCWVGRATKERLVSALDLAPEGNARLEKAFEKYQKSLGEFCVLRQKQLQADKLQLERLLEPAVFDDVALAALPEVERLRILDLKRRRANGEDVFDADPEYWRRREVLADENTALLWKTERELRSRLEDEIFEATGSTNLALRDSIRYRLVIDGVGEARLSQHWIRDNQTPTFWFDFYRVLRAECGPKGSLRMVGDAVFSLNEPNDAQSTLAKNVQALLIRNDAYMATTIDEWLQARSRVAKPARDEAAEARGFVNSHARTKAVVRTRWNAATALRDLLRDGGDPVAADSWMDAFCSAMFTPVYAADGLEGALNSAAARLDAADPRLPIIEDLQRRYLSDRRDIRWKYCGALVEEVTLGGSLAHPDAGIIKSLQAELAALKTNTTGELRGQLKPEEFDDWCKSADATSRP